jgi:hypothetical protein
MAKKIKTCFVLVVVVSGCSTFIGQSPEALIRLSDTSGRAIGYEWARDYTREHSRQEVLRVLEVSFVIYDQCKRIIDNEGRLMTDVTSVRMDIQLEDAATSLALIGFVTAMDIHQIFRDDMSRNERIVACQFLGAACVGIKEAIKARYPL